MEQLNKVELRGRIGMVRFAQVADKTVCHMTVATNALYRNQSNTTVEEATWHNCTIWSGKRTPNLDCLKIGAPVSLVGRIKNIKYTTADGVDKYISEIYVTDFEIIPDGENFKPEILL